MLLQRVCFRLSRLKDSAHVVKLNRFMMASIGPESVVEEARDPHTTGEVSDSVAASSSSTTDFSYIISSSERDAWGSIEEEVAELSQQRQPRWLRHFELAPADSIDSEENETPETTLYCLGRSNRVRRACRRLVHWPYVASVVVSSLSVMLIISNDLLQSQFRWVDTCVLWLIVANCVFLAVAEDPLRRSHSYGWVYAGYVGFNALFCSEMLAWIAAYGLRRYIRAQHFARTLDLVLNVLSTLSLFPGLYEIETFRIIRILSAIRVFRSIQGLRVLGQAILHSLPSLFDVTLLMLFLFFIYGLVGLQTWFGEFRQRCFDCAPDPPPVCFSRRKLILPSDCLVNTGSYVFSPDRLCSMNKDRGYQCPSSSVCSDGSRLATIRPTASIMHPRNVTLVNGTSMVLPVLQAGPNYGFTNFDNMLNSLLTLFGMASLDSWVFVMYWAQDVDGFAAWVFFVSFVLLCSFFATNLIVAVIVVKYQEFSGSGGAASVAQTEDEASQEYVLPRELRPLAQLVAPLGTAQLEVRHTESALISFFAQETW